MADAEKGLVAADGNTEASTYGSADTGGSDKPPPFDAVGEDPPSYSSMMQELRDAKKTSSGTVDFVTRIISILINTLVFTVFMAVAIAVPLAMVIMGAIHINDCPVQRLIPIFLIVSGSVYIVKTVLDLAIRYRKRREGGGASESSHLRENSVSRLFACILFIFFILGNVWVYANFKPDDDPSSLRYCYPPLYYFAFWLITLTYIFFILTCCCGCCVISAIGISLAT